METKKYIFIFVFLLHFLIDVSITLLSFNGCNIYTIATWFIVVAVIAILYMWKSETWFPEKEIIMNEYNSKVIDEQKSAIDDENNVFIEK